MAGLFIGGTIHDVAQVVGAGYTLGTEAGDNATIVKRFRVAMLAAVVLVASIAFNTAREQGAEANGLPGAAAKQALVPWFLWLFAAMVALNSSGALSAVVQQGMGWVSRACLVVAIAALGMKTSFMQLTPGKLAADCPDRDRERLDGRAGAGPHRLAALSTRAIRWC